MKLKGLVAAAVVCAFALVGCASGGSASTSGGGKSGTTLGESVVILGTDPKLLTANEVGAGYKFVSHPIDYSRATLCGPDDTLLFYVRDKKSEIVEYSNGKTTVRVGASPLDHGIKNEVELITEELNSPGCKNDSLEPGTTVAFDWKVWPVEGFGQDEVAFQSVKWVAKKGKPDVQHSEEVPADNGDFKFRSSARAYGNVDGYLVTVQLDNHTNQPPSAAELKRLWAKQVEKIKESKQRLT